MINQANNKRIAKNTIYLYIRMVLVLLINLYITRILLRALGVEDFGIYNVVGGVVSFMSFLQSSMANGYQRFFNIALGKGNNDEFIKLVSASICVQLLICLLFLLLTETIGLWFVNSQMSIPDNKVIAANIVYQSSIFIFFLTMLSSPFNAVIISYEKMNVFAYLSVLYVALKLFIAYILFLWNEDRLIYFSIMSVLVQIILFFSYFFVALKQNDCITIKPNFDKLLIKDIAGFSGWNLFGTIAHSLKGQGINIILNLFFDPIVNAARGVAYQVSAGVNQCYQSFQTAARPQVMKYYAQNKIDNMLDLTYRISRFSFMLLWIVDFPLLFTSDYYIHLWLGENVPPLAPLFTNIVLLTILLECFSHPISNLAHATGQMKEFQIGTSVMIMLIIPLSYFALSFWAIPEIALYCSMIMAPVVQCTRLFLVRRILPFSIRKYIKLVFVPCIKVALLCVVPVALFIKYFAIDMHPILTTVMCMFFSLLIILLVGCTNNERQFLLSKLKFLRKMSV